MWSSPWPGTRSDLAEFRRYFLFSSGRLLSTFSFFWNIFRKISVRRVSSVFLFFLLEDTGFFLFFNLDAWMIQPRLDSSRNHCERASGRATERRYSWRFYRCTVSSQLNRSTESQSCVLHREFVWFWIFCSILMEIFFFFWFITRNSMKFQCWGIIKIPRKLHQISSILMAKRLKLIQQ